MHSVAPVLAQISFSFLPKLEKQLSVDSSHSMCKYRKMQRFVLAIYIINTKNKSFLKLYLHFQCELDVQQRTGQQAERSLEHG